MKKILLLFLSLIAVFIVNAASATTLSLPIGLKIIDEEAFYGDSGFDEVILPEGIEAIGAKAFAKSSLRSITLPSSIGSIGEDAFESETVLKVIANTYAYSWAMEHGYPNIVVTGTDSLIYYLSNSEWTIIGYDGSSSLSYLTIPESVTSMGEYCFYQCSKLESVAILGAITDIGKGCFYRCSSLRSVTLPDSLIF